MKTKTIAAALAMVALAAPLALAPADAQVVTRTTTVSRSYLGYRHLPRRVCSTVYRNHRRVTRCVHR